LLGSNTVARQLVPRPLQAPGEDSLIQSHELLALPWSHLIEHARQRPEAPLQLPLWSGLRLLALAQAGPLLRAPVMTGSGAASRGLPANAMATPLRTSELLLIQQAMQEAHGNVSVAARNLGLSRATLYRRLASK
jgi:DNA-binding NtrC family response regulator